VLGVLVGGYRYLHEPYTYCHLFSQKIFNIFLVPTTGKTGKTEDSPGWRVGGRGNRVQIQKEVISDFEAGKPVFVTRDMGVYVYE
jgi:hypothetical protein